MNKYIVTTTINPPTKALKLFSLMEGWNMIVVGDLKTPHDLFKGIMCKYLHPDYQEKYYKNLSDIIGWNCIQRRNIGFIEAYNNGADIIASVDDDNIPYDNWGKDLLIGKPIDIIKYVVPKTFDPLSIFDAPYWHRGFPLDELINRRPTSHYIINNIFNIQADLWNGDPDIDAFYRIEHNAPKIMFPVVTPYCGSGISPFNSQNTFFAREVIPFYSVLPGIGRMDDIWGSYIAQYDYPCNIVYNSASVYQERNVHNFMKDFEAEVQGYVYTPKLLSDLKHYRDFLPDQSKEFLDIYRSYF